ncbi:hypothetical protein OAG1_17810 [Agarivorans sp. OAG1]|nr:hypothetical protein OAG1_17810 [Agarivorans sp. OAG1]
MIYLVRIQQILYFVALILWGQSAIRYAMDDSFGNRFVGATGIATISLVVLAVSYYYPRVITYISSVFIVGIVALITLLLLQ